MNTLLNKLNKKKSGKKGFTLMEMLIVIAIIAILIAIAIPTMTNALTKAKIATDEANLRAYYSEALMDYMLEEKSLEAVTDQNKVTVDGVEYTLQAGKYTTTVSADGSQLTITYSPNSDKFADVTIPGAQATTGGSGNQNAGTDTGN